MTLAEEIETIFLTRGYMWKIGDVRRFPTVDDIQKTLTNMKEEVDKKTGEVVVLEVGRLVMIKSEDKYDVYVHFGEYDE